MQKLRRPLQLLISSARTSAPLAAEGSNLPSVRQRPLQLLIENARSSAEGSSLLRPSVPQRPLQLLIKNSRSFASLSVSDEGSAPPSLLRPSLRSLPAPPAPFLGYLSSWRQSAVAAAGVRLPVSLQGLLHLRCGGHMFSLPDWSSFDPNGHLESLARDLWNALMQTPDGAVLGLIGANVAVFMLWRIANPQFMRKNFMNSLGNFKNGRLHTLLTSAFSHIDTGHLAANMFSLYFFGSNIAKLFGAEFLLELYLAGALGGSIFFLVHRAIPSLFSEGSEGWSRVHGLGASAAVNSMILLTAFLFPTEIFYVHLLIPVPAALMGAILIGTDLWRMKKGDQFISGASHLGGAAVAALVYARIEGWI